MSSESRVKKPKKLERFKALEFAIIWYKGSLKDQQVQQLPSLLDAPRDDFEKLCKLSFLGNLSRYTYTKFQPSFFKIVNFTDIFVKGSKIFLGVFLL